MATTLVKGTTARTAVGSFVRTNKLHLVHLQLVVVMLQLQAKTWLSKGVISLN
jgi:hypothetical protein